MSLLLGLPGASLHPPVDPTLFDVLAARQGVPLPPDHRAALLESNGAEVYGGYARLFGLGASRARDALQWNEPECWRFAWEGRCSRYWCFAETAWGDQYAYDTEELREGRPRVYFLHCLTMLPNEVASSFSDFMAGEFSRQAHEPYDRMIVEARQAFGTLDAHTQLVYTPSLLLGGPESIERAMPVPAQVAMTLNGDIAVQLDAGPPRGTVKAVRPYEDAAGRSRVRLEWEPQPDSSGLLRRWLAVAARVALPRRPSP